MPVIDMFQKVQIFLAYITAKLSHSQEEIIKLFKEKHGNKYDYSKVDYRGNKKKIVIICPDHGEFEMSPIKHLKGQACKRCTKGEVWSTAEFISKANEVHGEGIAEHALQPVAAQLVARCTHEVKQVFAKSQYIGGVKCRFKISRGGCCGVELK